jgi:putative transposase
MNSTHRHALGHTRHHPPQDKKCRFDLIPPFGTKLSMIFANERGRVYVEEQAHGSADDLKQVEAGRAVEDVAREVGVSKHTLYAWKAKYGGMDVGQVQEAKQLRDENTRLRKLVADLSLDKEALQSVIRKNGWSS